MALISQRFMQDNLSFILETKEKSTIEMFGIASHTNPLYKLAGIAFLTMTTVIAEELAVLTVPFHGYIWCILWSTVVRVFIKPSYTKLIIIQEFIFHLSISFISSQINIIQFVIMRAVYNIFLEMTMWKLAADTIRKEIIDVNAIILANSIHENPLRLRSVCLKVTTLAIILVILCIY